MKIELKDLRLLFTNLIYAHQTIQVVYNNPEIEKLCDEIVRICYLTLDQIDDGEIDSNMINFIVNEIERLRYQITIK